MSNNPLSFIDPDGGQDFTTVDGVESPQDEQGRNDGSVLNVWVEYLFVKYVKED